ncbi:MAG: cobalt transporter [Candidatus Thermoplasmatota archaeon]|nr:cobalt transporter [Euryarchaeota archaeon]MBU4031183.1 cobalt transporter [Candidatus Thermoplasmatota archaeon]MBU4071307.1 cobalt transporter [Candidatus Thermoplasmatota archaeon]MBU4143398.1 cobalt transporter [Candidatus Thermoplasmatota archaeon]MBU4592211.1 cobalt transporter [Candidatus Thermoplasmatota archaeon]
MHKPIDRKHIKIIAGILVIFAIGLVGYYLFSAEYGDGLEVTMEEAGVGESKPVYTGPLDYGDSYASSLAMGIIGFFVTLLVGFLLARLLRKSDA